MQYVLSIFFFFTTTFSKRFFNENTHPDHVGNLANVPRTLYVPNVSHVRAKCRGQHGITRVNGHPVRHTVHTFTNCSR